MGVPGHPEAHLAKGSGDPGIELDKGHMTQIARIGRSGDLERRCLEDKLGQEKLKLSRLGYS